MSPGIHFDYPVYFLVFCLIAGLLYAGFYYFRSDFVKNKRFFSFPNLMLASFRFVVVAMICFLLLSPFMRKQTKRLEKPVIVFAVDNSESLKLNKDSSFYEKDFSKKIRELAGKLNDNVEVDTFNFGNAFNSGLSSSLSEKKTNISAALEDIYNRYYNNNLGAVVLASDGIYNEGRDPLLLAGKFKSPVYTVALGDTIPQKDILIQDVQYNHLVYAHNKFPIEVTVKGDDCDGSRSTLSIKKDGKTLFTQQVKFDGDLSRQTINTLLEATEVGLQKYVIELSPVDGEISDVNNRKEVFIDVLESKKNILIVSLDPHPDVAAIKKAILNNEQYQVTTTTLKDFEQKPGELDKYNLVILHQIPGSNGRGSQLLKSIVEKKIPVWVILGSQSSLSVFNNASLGVKIIPRSTSVNTSLPYLSKDFNLFSISDKMNSVFKNLPPVYSYFAKYEFETDHSVMIYQKIGQVESDQPMLFFLGKDDQKIGILNGEGIWRWYLSEYGAYENHDVFNELIDKTVQYLAVKDDKRLFRLRDPKNLFYEDEPVTFEAEVYNKSYELLKDAKVKMKITDEDGNEYNFDFNESGSGYKLNAGYLPVGNYNYVASTSVSGKKYTVSGEFTVKTIDIEYLNTVADHHLMYQIAKETGGKMYFPNQLDQLSKTLNSQEAIKPVAYYEYQLQELINNKLLFLIILLFLSLEWFFRKFFGSY